MIRLEVNVLTISGEREGDQEGYYRIERASGRFARSVTLPEGVEPRRIEARFTTGVLEVRVPKPAEGEPQRVTIGLSRPVDPVEVPTTGSTPQAQSVAAA